MAAAGEVQRLQQEVVASALAEGEAEVVNASGQDVEVDAANDVADMQAQIDQMVQDQGAVKALVGFKGNVVGCMRNAGSFMTDQTLSRLKILVGWCQVV